MTVYMFPGQGSQIKGMGLALFDQFTDMVKQADEVLGYSIRELCLDDPKQQLAQTEFTQPALYIVEALAFLAKQEGGIKPNYCIGHSLGEYAALFAAGVFDFVTGLALVKKRGELMAQVGDGGMLAVLNSSQERIASVLKNNGLEAIDFANFNSSKQLVLSGLAGDIAKAFDCLTNENILCIPFPVSGAFHSRYMHASATEFEHYITPFKFKPLQMQVIANVNALPYTNDTVKDNLVKQITSSVRWTDVISYLKNTGESEFLEIGPGNVLTRLFAQN